MTFKPSGIDTDFASPADWARLYRLRGIQVVPAFMPGEVKKGVSWKRPLLKSWTEFQENLVPDEVFNPWYGPGGQYSTRPNMGIITGRASNNLFVIDLDYHKVAAAAQWWQGLMAVHNNGMELETVEQVTGGGGSQKLFVGPPGWTPPTNKTPIGVDIRGQGGFAMLAPSMHESGRAYEWLEGYSPDDIPVTMAPDWLIEAVDNLVREHGGGSTSSSKPNGAGPQGTYDAFGNQTDGREEKMLRMVWRCIVKWHRENPIRPSDAESAARCAREYEAYERGVTPRATGASKGEALDQEGRGPAEWGRKWRYAMKQWDGKVAEDARKPDPNPEDAPKSSYSDFTDEFAKERVDPETGAPLGLIQSDVEFTKGFKPPDYLIDGMIQKGYLYSLTGPTGHGKTPTAMLMGSRVARGVPFHGKPVTQGGVLFLAGENPDDIRARYIAMADHEGFAIGSVPFHFIEGVIDISAQMALIEAGAAKIPNLSLVIVDTDQAYFLGDEGNSNEQRKWFAKVLRRLLKLPGNPTVLVNCHPVKNAGKDNLVPIGGSSFLNEVDGNITCWAEDRTTTIQPHGTKWRGVPFEGVAFELRTVTTDKLMDSKGRPIPSVMAFEISEEGAARRASVAEEDDKSVLRMIHRDKRASLVSIAKALGWFWPDGSTPSKSKVQRVIDRLKASKLVYNHHGGKHRVTKKGCKIIGEKWDADGDD